ncbi:MAG TPA: hypothetical protein VFO63_08315 [Blastocatellia bacterium]|nr:hypothetical protein [Blastocatellia bacterium]
MADYKGSDENVIAPGTPVIVYMHSPREKMWGLLTELDASGVFIHGIDLNTFEDWTMMLVRGERNIGLSHVFFPMWRVERIMLDETVDDIPSMADKFYARVGLTIYDFLKR